MLTKPWPKWRAARRSPSRRTRLATRQGSRRSEPSGARHCRLRTPRRPGTFFAFPPAQTGSGICGPDFEISEILFLEIWNRAILFLRPPMTRIVVAKLSQTPTPHASSRRRAESSTARGRLSHIAEDARPSSAPAVGRRMAARGLLNVRLRERDDPDVGRAAPAGREGNFSSLQTLENKRNRIGIPPNPAPSEHANATAATI